MTDEEQGRLAALETLMLAMIQDLRRSDVVTPIGIFKMLGRASELLTRSHVAPLTQLAQAHAEATLKHFARTAGEPVHGGSH